MTLPLKEAMTGHFFKPTKSGNLKLVDAPFLGAPVADTHAHLNQLASAPLALARAGIHNVAFLGNVLDIVEDLPDEELSVLDRQATDELAASLLIRPMSPGRVCGAPAPHPPKVRLIVGCHPHHASDFDEAAMARLREAVTDRRVAAIGEIGLDYHYDFSPREEQRTCFEQQIELAHELGLPVVLHIREAHDDALAILNGCGWPEAGVLLHCCTIGPDELTPWVDHDAYVAFGGAATFGRSDAIRESATVVPASRLLTETDAPYMAPHPLRGQYCEPAMVVFAAAAVAEERAGVLGDDRRTLLESMLANARALLDREAQPWQTRPVASGDVRAAQAIAQSITAQAASETPTDVDK